MSDEKMTRVEETLMHQEELLGTLNKMVVQQWAEIDLLKKHIRELRNEMNAVTETTERLSSGASEKPPHY